MILSKAHLHRIEKHADGDLLNIIVSHEELRDQAANDRRAAEEALAKVRPLEEEIEYLRGLRYEDRQTIRKLQHQVAGYVLEVSRLNDELFLTETEYTQFKNAIGPVGRLLIKITRFFHR